MTNLLKGVTVKIIVIDPFEWDQGNLFGTIVKVLSDVACIIQLTKPVVGKQFNSDLIEISARHEDVTLESLSDKNPITVGGAIIDSLSGKRDYIIIGDLTIPE